MKLTKQQLKRIIKEELEGELTEQDAPETGEWDKRDILQKFFDQLKNAVYMSKQWRTVKEGREVIEDLGRQAVDVRKAGKWTLTRGDDDIL